MALWSFGRTFWCRCGEWFLWSGEVQSMHNSQHLADPYSLTHLSHGLGFYALLRLVPIPEGWRFAAAVALEAGWEVLENTPMVIDRYREATISLGYYGDTIANSGGDLLACVLGWVIAASVPARWSLILFLATELLLLAAIRDNLTLNVIMLLWPIDAIRRWQGGL